jgi:hypothetical protein
MGQDNSKEINEKELLVLYYTNFDFNFDIKYMMKLSYVYNYPPILFLKKFIERIYYSYYNKNIKKELDNLLKDMSLETKKTILEDVPKDIKKNLENNDNNNDKNNDNNFIDYLIKNIVSVDIIDKKYIDKIFIDKLIKVIQSYKKETPIHMYKVEDFDKNILKEHIDIFSQMLKKNNYTNMNISHQGLPIPHSINGRPKIGWCECYYDGCHNKFESGQELIDHLKYYGCYTPNYHVCHEEIVLQNNKITPKYFIENKITTCPSWICKNKNFVSPEEVIEHFQELGIYPFWQEGITIKPKTGDINYLNKLDTKFYNSETCVICIDHKPSIINYPCLHHVYCI